MRSFLFFPKYLLLFFSVSSDLHKPNQWRRGTISHLNEVDLTDKGILSWIYNKYMAPVYLNALHVETCYNRMTMRSSVYKLL